MESRIAPVGYVAFGETPNGPGGMPARDGRRMDGPSGHLSRPDASLLKRQALNFGKCFCPVKMVMEGNMISMEAVACYCVCGFSLAHAEVESTAAKLTRALI